MLATASSTAHSAAFTVVTTSELLREIATYIPGVPLWTVEYEHMGPKNGDMAISRKQRVKQSMGTPGLLPRLAIANHDVMALERLFYLHRQPQFRRKGKFWFTNAAHDAAVSGNLNALEWLHARGVTTLKSFTASMVAASGHAQVLQWLLARDPGCLKGISSTTIENVAADGYFEVIKILHENCAKKSWSRGVMDRAAANGHLDIVRFLHEHRSEGCTPAAVDLAAAYGHTPVIEWLLTHHNEGFTSWAAQSAAVNGHVAIVQLLWQASVNEHLQSEVKTAIRRVVATIFERGPEEMARLALEILENDVPACALKAAQRYMDLQPMSPASVAGAL